MELNSFTEKRKKALGFLDAVTLIIIILLLLYYY